MPPDRGRIRQALKEFDFDGLFIEELGWDRPPTGTVEVSVDGSTYRLAPVAHKRGMVVFLCAPSNGTIPNHPTRSKIERQATKAAHEHIIIYTDGGKETQIWQWVRREPGRPTASRQHSFHRSQSGEALAQKLEALAFELSEEDSLTIAAVAGRARHAFDVDRVTKRFYDRFKSEHADFFKFVTGIQSLGDREWYASVMLNRLMFVYFIQKKGFLDGDTDYLRNRLRAMQQRSGKDNFFSFYRHFLLRLFHEGLGQRPRTSALDELLGKVPYLNGGLFDVHELEAQNTAIEIADEAFEKVFDFFDAYQWHLDERPLRTDNEINPDVLGYIFEKYINQKELGAYYTKEDITEYISTNTIVPRLLEAARAECEVAFEPASASWRLLADVPERYIPEPARRGVAVPFPQSVEKGIDDIGARSAWNMPAPPEIALPTETWREHVARRERYERVRTRLASGDINDIDELVTSNLNLRQFAQDLIDNAEGPELVRAVYGAIGRLTVLDPTCGSGAFLFAALNILEPLYEACLDRMESFVEEDELPGKKQRRPGHFTDFRKTLEAVAQHPNRRYFVLKSIIINNLFGVDIMEEAVEICKLRLFLKLVAQVERVEDIEPLPDIDFNIRAGNSLVGFANYTEVEHAIKGDVQTRIDLGDDMDRIDDHAQAADRAFSRFRTMQTDHELDAEIFTTAKADLRGRLRELSSELNRYLATEYGIDPNDAASFQDWSSSYKPFHWFAEFYGIIKTGGFEVIIGNPPYLELREVDYSPKGFATKETAAVHAMCVERGLKLLHALGCMSMILPLSVVSTQRMQIVQELLETDRSVWYANFSWRPGKLFDTVNRALTIFVTAPSKKAARTFSTSYQKWNSHSRATLMPAMVFVEVLRDRDAVWVPKLGHDIERAILDKCLAVKTTLGRHIVRTSSHRVYYRTTGGLYWKVFTDFAPAFKMNGEAGHSTRETSFGVLAGNSVKPAIALLSSDLYWWWYTITSNCRDLNPYDIRNFPVPESALTDERLTDLGEAYLEDLKKNSTMLVRNQKQTGRTETQAFKIQKSKPVIDEIDRALAKHYGFTAEELDFLVNYDIKYRLGSDSDENA